MVVKVGMIGVSPGNGHPFSFSAIINGYDKVAFAQTGWRVILDYLEQRPHEAGIPGLKVTHAWTQSPAITELLCRACHIETSVEKLEHMIDQVDAVIIARDDERSHYQFAKPMLEAGKHVFIDKPLSLNESELDFFKPFITQGKLMSTSGLRFAHEVFTLRGQLKEIGEVLCIEGVVVNQLVKYGIHLLDALATLELGHAVEVTRLPGKCESYSILLDTGILFTLHCLGESSKVFRLSVFGTKGSRTCDITDNFSAFKQTLLEFARLIETGHLSYNQAEVLSTMRLLRDAQKLQPGQRVLLQ